MNQTLRGMKDLFSKNLDKHNHIIRVFQKIASQFCYEEVSTPVLEATEVFTKTLGHQTDIIQKEVYQFVDKGDHSIALRPEGTAGIVRFLLSEKLYRREPLRFQYTGPMFRYERPQKGRLRQFHQIGIELFGLDQPEAELEQIELAHLFLEELDLLPKVSLKINTLGDQESQKTYRKKLVEYLTPYKKDLSEDSQIRLDKNPLRILDSKSAQDQKILKEAPSPSDCLNTLSRDFYNSVCSLLQKRGINFQQCDHLVRGLDYYTHTIFEYVSSDLGSQDALLAGGRYNNLVQDMGGPFVPSIGFAAGLERIALLIKDLSSSSMPVAIVYSDPKLKEEAYTLAYQLRKKGISIYIPENPALTKQMKKADKKNCSKVLLIGIDEWSTQQVILKDMKSGDQKLIHKDQVASVLLS